MMFPMRFPLSWRSIHQSLQWKIRHLMNHWIWRLPRRQRWTLTIPSLSLPQPLLKSLLLQPSMFHLPIRLLMSFHQLGHAMFRLQFLMLLPLKNPLLSRMTNQPPCHRLCWSLGRSRRQSRFQCRCRTLMPSIDRLLKQQLGQSWSLMQPRWIDRLRQPMLFLRRYQKRCQLPARLSKLKIAQMSNQTPRLLIGQFPLPRIAQPLIPMRMRWIGQRRMQSRSPLLFPMRLQWIGRSLMRLIGQRYCQTIVQWLARLPMMLPVPSWSQMRLLWIDQRLMRLIGQRWNPMQQPLIDQQLRRTPGLMRNLKKPRLIPRWQSQSRSLLLIPSLS